jgi:hypothetical protein
LAKYRAGGNQLPKTLKVGVSEIITRRYLESFRGDARHAPQGIAAHANMMQPRMCEVALSL